MRCFKCLLNKRELTPIHRPSEDFLSFLERVAYQLRMTCNIHGLFPNFQRKWSDIDPSVRPLPPEDSDGVNEKQNERECEPERCG